MGGGIYGDGVLAVRTQSKDHKNNHLYGYSKDCEKDNFIDCDDCFYMSDEYGCEDDLQNLNTGNKQNEDFTNVILGRVKILTKGFAK